MVEGTGQSPAPAVEISSGTASAAATPRTSGGPRRVSELALRVLFAAVAAPATIYIVRAGGAPLAILLSAAAAIGAWELFRLAKASGSEPLMWLGIPLSAMLPLYVALEPRGTFELPPALLAAMLLLVLAAAIWLRGASGRPLEAVATTLLGIGYTGGLLSFAEGIRYHRYLASDAGGTALLLLPVLLTWVNDIGSYFSGRLFGRRKLLPSISPGKTVAGAVGGFVAGVAFCWIYVPRVLQPVARLGMTPRNLLVFAIVVCAVGQIGDLAESLLKREAGVKDSSGIFPGHGGMLDRIDSLLFVLPTAWALFTVPGLLLPAP
jgi:phosphatidate cytidylyltransferase